ncbi:hypothetical protein HDU97_008866 [Phlyctochytrium planicorne]|nr:hypothetical protein HDU97_008866 [Phlyctochytrium planicorne]
MSSSQTNNNNHTRSSSNGGANSSSKSRPNFPFMDLSGNVHGRLTASVYRVDKIKAKGSFSTVLLATCLFPPIGETSLATGMPVALKCIEKAGNAAAVTSQRREADLLVRLQDDNPHHQQQHHYHEHGGRTSMDETRSSSSSLSTSSPSSSSSSSSSRKWLRNHTSVSGSKGEKGGSKDKLEGGCKKPWGVVGFYEAIETETHLILAMEYCETGLLALNFPMVIILDDHIIVP